MRVLVVGQGGREHALCWKLRQSPSVTELYAAPGNAGIADLAYCVPIGVADIVELADFAEKLKIDLTVIGPELPLTLGIVDEFRKRDLTIFGPSRLAADLEGSKAFSKDFMRKYEIPTAESVTCSSYDEGVAATKKAPWPKVIKVDGLAGGKGVFIVGSKGEAEEVLGQIFHERRFGNAADRVLVEEFLDGEEVSFLVLTDGKRVAPLAPTKDYKKAFDGDQGPNTGGMGAHSPALVLSSEMGGDILRRIVIPTIQGMEAEGRSYSGCLYVGLMLTDDGPKVLEYNCRFGDPETQAQMLRLESDLAEVLLQIARGELTDTKLTWRKEASACIVVAAEGYPGEFVTGTEIAADASDDPAVVIFHAGTKKADGKTVIAAGRVLNVCARGATLSEALKKAYGATVRSVRGEGLRFRKDIGKAALEKRQTFT
ncbi:MAG TPA: phosphoribosylamine--glycine ligase [Thermoanaerobaculia bacterium]|nr:phosphoribosylamine--glycine ligase [Thermoanaerobaculia bacterium]